MSEAQFSLKRLLIGVAVVGLLLVPPIRTYDQPFALMGLAMLYGVGIPLALVLTLMVHHHFGGGRRPPPGQP
jgi:hypothetical protein